MASEWKKHRIKDVVSFVVDNRGKTPPTQDGGHILLEVNAVSATEKFPLYREVRKHVSQEIYDTRFRKGHPKKGDILVPTVGTLGAVSLMDRDDCCIAQNLIAIRCDEAICHSHFLYYVLCNPMTRKRLLNLNIGGVQPSIKVPHLMELEIELPSIQEQKKIVELLSLLDDKIFCNKRINDNLQRQAQAIYTAMFISKADPTWAQGRLSDLITVKYGKDHKKLADGTYPVFGSGGIMRYVERPLYTGESVLIPRKGTLNNVMYVNEPFWSVDTMFFTEMKIPNVAKFVFHFVKAKDLASMNAGSAVPSMTTDILNAMELAIPSTERLAEFESVVAPMYQAMQANNLESAKLAELRDALLPKLMSGEIDVSKIQKTNW